MKSVWLQRGSRRRALVFFAGWGMDERPMRRLTSSTYDVCVCFDYRGFDSSIAARSAQSWSQYQELAVVAWSFGCAVAVQVMDHIDRPVQNALAINGTVTPESESVGIPPRLLDATSENLLQGGWTRFVRRMCLDKAARHHFDQHAPQRDLPGALTELEVLRRLQTPTECKFKCALIGTHDRIIVPENQQRGWQRFGVSVKTFAAPHYPFHLWSTWEEVLAEAVR